MFRKIYIASTFAMFLLAGDFFVQSASAQGKTTTDTHVDKERDVIVVTTKDENGNVINEKESDPKGNLLKETRRELDKNGNCTKETVTDGQSKIIKEAVTEYDKDGNVTKRTITEYYPNGKKKSETVIINDASGSHGTRKDWDEDGNPKGGGKVKQSSIEGHSNRTSTESPLRTVTFNSTYGNMVVNLPVDIAAGNTISGTVIMKPAGNGDAERSKNAAELSGYVIQLDGSGNAGKAILGKAFTFTIPAGGAALSLWLLRSDGMPAAVVDLPVAPKSVPAQVGYAMPKLGQAGRPVAIQGRFDGDLTNTSLQLDSRDLNILAESQNSMVFEASTSATGPGRLTLMEGSTTVESDFNNVRVSLTAPVTTLAKGQKTVVTARVEGLQGLPSGAYPLSLDLMNMSPTVIALENSKSSTLAQPVRYTAVDQSGSYTVDVSVRGIRAGSYTLEATAHSNR